MGAVGLLYVGAVLVVNGLMLLGYVEARSAAPLNLFVGALQVITPTFLIFTSGGDIATILGASGIYLFGFTYLYVGINLLAGLDGTGLGWFSAFVAASAVVFAGLNLWYVEPSDSAFAVIWLYWAILWSLFFVVLGLGRVEWTRYTGAIAIVAGILTTAVPAFLLLTNQWAAHQTWWTTSLVILLALSLVACYPLRSRYQPAAAPGSTVPEGAVPSAREPAVEESRHRAPSA